MQRERNPMVASREEEEMITDNWEAMEMMIVYRKQSEIQSQRINNPLFDGDNSLFNNSIGIFFIY